MATRVAKIQPRKIGERPRSQALGFRNPRSTTVSRWGNSLGVRIPQETVDQLQLTAGAQVTVEVRGGAITIRPVKKRKKWTEAELLKGVTPDRVGGEVNWGPPAGKEVW